MRKIIPLLFGILIFLPVINTLAAEEITNIKVFKTPLMQMTNDNFKNTSKTAVNLPTTITSQAVTPWNKTALIFELPTGSIVDAFTLNSSGGSVSYSGFNDNWDYVSWGGPFSPGTQTLTLPDDKQVKYVVLYPQTPNSNITVASLKVFQDYVIDPISYDPVLNLIESHTYKSADLSWKNPTGSAFRGVIIKKNGVEVTTLSNVSSSYSINGLDPSTTYNFDVVAKYSDGINSTPKSISVTTDAPPEPAGEIIELKAVPTHERVDLSWKLPESQNYKHVNIYRDTIIKTSFIDSLLGVQMVYAAEKKIFETNGTYFNDLTVDPETTYEYTLTTTSKELIESEGVTTKVTTLGAPSPEIIGGDYEKDPVTGDFTFTWSEPSKGQVKIMVGGSLYKTVSGADKRIIIPKGDMKYTVLGDPDVSLIAVAEDGKESVPVSPGVGETLGSVKIPFDAKDALLSGTSLLWIIGPFVLLTLAFLLVPKLRALITNAFSKKNGKEEATRRSANDIKTERIKELKEHREQREKREREERIRSNERTVDLKDDLKEKAIVKAERMPKERRVREPKPARTKRERVRTQREPRQSRIGRERS